MDSRATSRASILDPNNISFVNDEFIENGNHNDIKQKLEDDELKRLSKYFEDSRVELQKKVESILNINLIENSSIQYSQKNILEAKKPDPANLPGKPIALSTALELRKLTVSSCVHRFSDEWRRAKFVFRKEDSELTYGLLSEKNGSKGLILAIQAQVIKNLMIKSYSTISGEEVTDTKWQNQRRILNPNVNERKDALLKSLVDVLWNAGEKSYACVVLNGFKNSFEIEIQNDGKSKNNYVNDGLTEKLRYYEFGQYKYLEEFMRKNLNVFQRDDGVVLFLYSLLLSRHLEKIKDDLQGDSLIGDMEDCKIPIFNLVSIGKAIPFLHNNSVYYDKNGESLTTPLIGLPFRSDIGLLYWNHTEDDDNRTEVGSMLKTPKYPIWITLMNNLIAIIFCTNIELMTDWRLEQSFNLYFYSSLKKQEKSVKFNIDTRNLVGISDLTVKKKKSSFKKFKLFSIEDDNEPEIVETIHTKWPDCEIKDIDPLDIMALL